MSSYTDYLIYSPHEINSSFDENGLNYLETSRVVSGVVHYVYLVRSKFPITLVEEAELLASGHCDNDCPFEKLTSGQLVKYKLAYNTEPVITQDPITNQEIIFVPPFKFGVFI